MMEEILLQATSSQQVYRGVEFAGVLDVGALVLYTIFGIGAAVEELKFGLEVLATILVLFGLRVGAWFWILYNDSQSARDMYFWVRAIEDGSLGFAWFSGLNWAIFSTILNGEWPIAYPGSADDLPS